MAPRVWVPAQDCSRPPTIRGTAGAISRRRTRRANRHPGNSPRFRNTTIRRRPSRASIHNWPASWDLATKRRRLVLPPDERGFEISPAARRSADAAWWLRGHRKPAVARATAARGPAGIFRAFHGRRTARRDRRNPKAAFASSSLRTSSRKATSRRRSRSWSRASSAAIARRCCSASPARERPSRWRR